MKLRGAVIGLLLLNTLFARAQSTEDQVKPILERQLQSPSVVMFQLQQYLMERAPKLPTPTSAADWTTESRRFRKHLLDDVVFHGWPKAWIDAPPKFEDMGSLPTGKGYTLRKLRYEIVPGFYSTALLYEPANLQGKVPAVLNVLGHYGHIGKANETEQTFCINQALRGMIALRLEWIGIGELTDKDNEHWFAAHLDLVGANGIGLFYLAMRHGLDYLWQTPNVDRKRIAMTGLSGGGWQTITLSSLDERVQLSIPVAGYESIEERLSTVVDAGDIEQNATDLLVGQDYPTLTAMRAPRPTLLINNAEDDCCFRAAIVRPAICDAVRPFFRLFGKEESLQFYENTDISAHNYERTNHQQAYRFLAKHFGLPASEDEIPVGAELKTYSELAAGVPKDNLTILGLARNLAHEITRAPVPSDAAGRKSWADAQRAKLQDMVRYDPVTVKQSWRVDNTKHNGVESVSYRFLLSNGLSATGVWLKDIPTPDGAPLTLVINDKGKKAAAAEVWDYGPEVADRMDRNEQVLVLDLLFSGDAAPEGHPYLYAEMLAGTGSRPIGMEAAQLMALANWARATWSAPSIRIQSTGIRSQLTAVIASGLKPGFFTEVAVKDGMRSLSYLLEKPVRYDVDAPDLFCLDLYKDFDLDRLVLLAEPTKVGGQLYVQ